MGIFDESTPVRGTSYLPTEKSLLFDTIRMRSSSGLRCAVLFSSFPICPGGYVRSTSPPARTNLRFQAWEFVIWLAVTGNASDSAVQHGRGQVSLQTSGTRRRTGEGVSTGKAGCKQSPLHLLQMRFSALDVNRLVLQFEFLIVLLLFSL